MTAASARPLWRGRALAVLGILLCAFSLRSAVASLSPVLDYVSADFPLSPTVIGLIGTAPPACFAIFGLLTPLLERRFGLEKVTVIALVAMTAGLVLRGLSVDAISLLLTTALIFAGVGMGNILLPPLVKKYFPDRLGLMMTIYTTAMALSTFIPPLATVPLADAAGWRFSLSLWAVFAAAGLIPWMLLLLRGQHRLPPVPAADPPILSERHGAYDEAAEMSTGPIVVAPTSSRLFGRIARLPLAWALALSFGTSSTMAYVAFAWLPTMLTDLADVSAATAGLLLSLFAAIGLPASLIVPVLVVRFQATRPLYVFGAVGGFVGLVGLLLAPIPGLLWLWVILYGMVGILFPLSLVLISIRTRDPETAVALSSFAQSVGYTVAAIYPLLIGVLHDLSGGWQVPIIVIAVSLAASIPAGMVAGRQRTIEDEWEQRHGRW